MPAILGLLLRLLGGFAGERGATKLLSMLGGRLAKEGAPKIAAGVGKALMSGPARTVGSMAGWFGGDFAAGRFMGEQNHTIQPQPLPQDMVRQRQAFDEDELRQALKEYGVEPDDVIGGGLL